MAEKTIKYFARRDACLRYMPPNNETYEFISTKNTNILSILATTLAEKYFASSIVDAAWTFGRIIFHVGDVGG
jgi:hypothetical protein